MVIIKRIKIRKIKQYFNHVKIKDISNYIHQAIKASDLKDRINPGDKIGLTIGSRGIDNIKIIVKQIISEIKRFDAHPFILPAMGSHGGANNIGQKELLASYGITEEEMKVPIISSMDTVVLGKVEGSIPIYFSKDAMKADGIIALNRVKTHTDFKSRITESGISKVLVIGLGKEKGAASIHSLGVYGLKKVIPRAANLIIKKAPIIQGVGILENGYNQTMKILFVPPEDIIETDTKLLEESKQKMAKLPIDKIDVLVTQEIGKNISGTGFDTNVIGRLYINGEKEIENPSINKIVVLDLTEESHGNAYGIGLADITTKRLVNKINFKSMNTNLIASTFLNRGKIPITTETEEEAIELALKTCWQVEYNNIKLVIIKNTLDLEYLYISKEVWEKIKKNKNIEAYGDWEELAFDKNGYMKPRL